MSVGQKPAVQRLRWTAKEFYKLEAKGVFRGRRVELIDAGDDKVVAHMRGEMHGKASGASVAFSYWTVGTVRSGKMLRVEWFADRAEALEAAGLRE